MSKKTKETTAAITEVKAESKNRNVNEKNEIFFKEGSSAAFVLDLYKRYQGDSRKITEAIIKAEKTGDVKSINPAGRVTRIVSEINKLKKYGAHVAGMKA